MVDTSDHKDFCDPNAPENLWKVSLLRIRSFKKHRMKIVLVVLIAGAFMALVKARGKSVEDLLEDEFASLEQLNDHGSAVDGSQPHFEVGYCKISLVCFTKHSDVNRMFLEI